MKIAISSEGESLTSYIDRRFERCPYFIIIDTETKKFETVSNIGSIRKDGTNSTALEIILNNGVEAVITGDMRPGAYKILADANKKIITGVVGEIKKIIEEFRINEIKQCPLCGGVDLIRDYEKMKIKCKNCDLETSGIL
ncbi:NifB/NifX family molybdenum-iron cluster-binding protein [[Eubacterium] cellulosolvens]